jgi:hypothetical protein
MRRRFRMGRRGLKPEVPQQNSQQRCGCDQSRYEQQIRIGGLRCGIPVNQMRCIQAGLHHVHPVGHDYSPNLTSKPPHFAHSILELAAPRLNGALRGCGKLYEDRQDRPFPAGRHRRCGHRIREFLAAIRGIFYAGAAVGSTPLTLRAVLIRIGVRVHLIENRLPVVAPLDYVQGLVRHKIPPPTAPCLLPLPKRDHA